MVFSDIIPPYKLVTTGHKGITAHLAPGSHKEVIKMLWLFFARESVPVIRQEQHEQEFY